MLERILIPLDGSKTGASSLAYVEDLLAKLSTETKTEITLLQVLPATGHRTVGSGISASRMRMEADQRRLEKEASDYLHGVGESLRKKGAVVMTKVVVGSAPEEIVKAAEEMRADLIAMSTHGRSGISRRAFGSVTENVLRLGGKTPVTVIKPAG